MSALPDLSGLALVHREAPVGVFHQLSEEDLKQLDGEEGGCAITHERLKAKTAPNTGVGEEHAVFRVRKHPGDDLSYEGLAQYDFYFAKKLAEWVHRQIELGKERDEVLDPLKGTPLRRSDVDLLLTAYPGKDPDTVGAGQITELVRSGGGDELGEVPEFVRTAPLKDGFEYTAFAPFRRDASFSWMLEQTVDAFGKIVDTAEYFRIELEMKCLGDTVEERYWTELEGWIDAAAENDEHTMIDAFANGLVGRSGAHNDLDNDRLRAIVDALIHGNHVRARVQRTHDDAQHPDSLHVTVDITKQAMRMLVIRSAVRDLADADAAERRKWEARFRHSSIPISGRDWTNPNARASYNSDNIDGKRYCWDSWISEKTPCAPNSEERYNSWRGALSQMVRAVHCVCNAAERRGMDAWVPMGPFDYYVPWANQPSSLPAELLAASGPTGGLDAFYGSIDKVAADLTEWKIHSTVVRDARPKRTFAQAFEHLVFAQPYRIRNLSQWRPVMQTTVPIWYLVSNDWMRKMDERWNEHLLARRAAQDEGDDLEQLAGWALDRNDPDALRVLGRGGGGLVGE